MYCKKYGNDSLWEPWQKRFVHILVTDLMMAEKYAETCSLNKLLLMYRMKVVPNGVFPLVLYKMKAELGQNETWDL